ncbi:ComEC/Rec2-related protein [Elusimicrobium simillimum]|uniref:ComEC/Rec2 family competence protein n=1 Tax=Elusimicrobium simillimum TaxID=3143438 RepID=UPI003C6F1C28
MHIDYYKRPLFLFLIFYVIFILAKPSNIPDTDIYYDAPKEVVITGVVTQNPQTKNEKTTAIINVKSIDGIKTKSRTYAYMPEYSPAEFMDTVELRGYLKKPFSISVQGNFDWAKYLANKGVYTQLNADTVDIIKPAPLPVRALNYVRKDILNVFTTNFDADSAAILGGVVLGEKGQIPTELHKAFNDSGAMHLLVASGANVGFITLIIYYLCVLFGVKYNLRLPLALVFAGIYTVLAGADAPLVRAYLMTICASIGIKAGRNSGAFHGLAAAALIILLINPKSINDVGFQMSFLATAIILLSVTTFRVPPKWPVYIKAPLEIFLITTAVQLALLPIYSNIFYRFSVTAVVSNIFLVPLSAVLMGLGFLLYSAKVIGVKFIFKAVWAVCYAVLWLFKLLVDFFSSFSFPRWICRRSACLLW